MAPLPDRSTIITVGSAILACTAAFVALQTARRQHYDRTLYAVTPSPLKTVVPHLSSKELGKLDYGPNYLPGARDVSTPYGSVRVYEWGPEDGHKVLFVHGISTPCISLGGLAHELVKRGCRVMLYDLYGRGFSDNPPGHEHTSHLYISQIHSVLASSPLSWTGPRNAFYIIGYSLGGGIAASFTHHHPHLVASLVLLATSGIVREKHVAWRSLLLYRTQGVLPYALVRRLVAARLDDPAALSTGDGSGGEEGVAEKAGLRFAPEEALAAETGAGSGEKSINAVMDRAVQWQLRYHAGFVDAFISAIRHAPITGQHELWRTMGARLSEQKKKMSRGEGNVAERPTTGGMVGGKLILLLGKTDPIVIPEEVGPDCVETVGEDNVHYVVVDAGHDIPISKPKEVADALWSFWDEHQHTIT